MTELRDLTRSIKRLALTYVHAAGSGHPGGSLSVAPILAALYFDVARPQPYDPDDPRRDVVVLSKGHAAPSLYACWQLLLDRGHPRPPWWGDGPVTLRKLGSPFQGHPSLAWTPWCETSTGSLGQGFAVAAGMALAAKQRQTGQRVFCVLGDGECQEGIVAEVARLASFYHLDNLVAVVDLNGLASDRRSAMVADPVAEFRAWGWAVLICDNGDDPDAVANALKDAIAVDRPVPRVVVAVTTKGAGWPRAEDDEDRMHGSVTLGGADLAEALEALDDT